MFKKYFIHYSLLLTLAQISSIIVALWVLYVSLELKHKHVVNSISIQIWEGETISKTLVWGVQFFLLSFVIALIFITVAFFISFRDD